MTNVCSRTLLTVLCGHIPCSAMAAPKLYAGVSVKGAVAYQDHLDKQQFHYVPGSVPVVLGDSLSEFTFRYWGVGRPMLIDTGGGLNKSVIGGVIGGRATLDLSGSQRQALIDEIKSRYSVENPKLIPVVLDKPVVQPVISQPAFGLKASNGDLVFPSDFQIAKAFAFSVGTQNSRLFAQTFADRNIKDDLVVPNPLLALNITGNVEFQGDPWTANCKADLSQVWSSVRQRYSASVSLGWFRVGSAEYASISQDLTRSKAIDCTFTEGSLDNEKFGRQIFEMVKDVLSAVNGDGDDKFFKFEPNPQPQETGSGSAAAAWGWSLNINGSYSSAYFKQSITYAKNISYTGRVVKPVPMSMILAVSCNTATEHLFGELGDSEPCVTTTKARSLEARVNRENAAKTPRVTRLLDRYLDGAITQEQYERGLAALNSITLTEDLGAPREIAISLSPKAETSGVFMTTLSEKEINNLVEKAISSK